MSYVALNTIDVPTTGTTIPTNWGVAVNNNFAAHQTAITTNASNIANITSEIGSNTTNGSMLYNILQTQNSVANLIAGATTFTGTTINFANSISVGYNLLVGNTASIYGSLGVTGSISSAGNISGSAFFASNGNFQATSNSVWVAVAQGNQQMTLQTASGSTNVVFPGLGLPALSGNEAIYNTTSHQLGYASSKAELKDNIRFLSEDGLANKTNPIYKLRPRIFKWKNETLGEEEVGFIAEEVYEDAPIVSILEEEHTPSFYKQRSILALAVEAIQSLSKRIDTLEMQLNQSMQSINTTLPALYTLGTKAEDEADGR